MIVRSSPGSEHSTKVMESKQRKLILGKGGDNGAPSSGGLMRRIVENLAGKEGELGLGIEVDEVMVY